MAQFSRLEVLNTVTGQGLVPLFYNANIEKSKQVAKALADGGCRVLEFTNRGDFAIEVFSALVKYCMSDVPELIVGIGSVDDAPTAALYIAHGANFIVGPTFNVEIARLCNRHKIPYMPGCATLNEIATAEEWGVEIVKLFPGNTSGGPEFVKAIKAPRPWTTIMPTGGVGNDEANLREWFSAGVVAVGMGSKLVRSDLLAKDDYATISQLAEESLSRIKAIRESL